MSFGLSLDMPCFVCSGFNSYDSVHWGINPLLKNTAPSCQAPPPLNRQTVQAPLLYWFLVNPPPLPPPPPPPSPPPPPPLKVGSFSEPRKY